MNENGWKGGALIMGLAFVAGLTSPLWAPVGERVPDVTPVAECDEDIPHYAECVVWDDSDETPGDQQWHYVWPDHTRTTLGSHEWAYVDADGRVWFLDKDRG